MGVWTLRLIAEVTVPKKKNEIIDKKITRFIETPIQQLKYKFSCN
jgi:hypothetical protein